MGSNPETLVITASNSEILIAGASAFVAICALVVAVCALVATVRQGRQNYMHNKLSVKPRLMIATHTHKAKTDSEISCSLINSGLGPAIIKDFILIYDGVEISKNNSETYDAFWEEKVPNHESLHYGSLSPKSAIPINEPNKILSIKHTEAQDISFIKKTRSMHQLSINL